MALQEQTKLAQAYQCAKAAHEAATGLLALVPASVRLTELNPLLQYVAGLRNAENTAWNRYLSASLNTAADQAERSLFVVASIHEGTNALAA